jgi:4,5-dihydroxyphthalate decarboxylase
VNEVAFTLAMSDYDHVRDLPLGRVPTPGMRITYLDLDPPELNGRFSLYREWEVGEYGLGKYIAQRAAGDDSITAIPVFPARAFRQSCLYVLTNSPLERPEDLAGMRVGIPEWAQTAVVYARGFLTHQYGLDLASIRWLQAGVSRPGRVEKVAVRLPDGVTVEPRPSDTLEGLLLAGEIDAVISAQPLDGFMARDGRIRRLFRDPRAVEESYWRETGIFPIMHTIALRRDLVDAHPWVAIELTKAFETAKRRSIARLLDAMAWNFPLPWITDDAERVEATFGPDFYPYGIEPNRTTLEALLSYAFEQGVAAKLLTVEELFHPTTHAAMRL